jgi:hypothetical protein
MRASLLLPLLLALMALVACPDPDDDDATVDDDDATVDDDDATVDDDDAAAGACEGDGDDGITLEVSASAHSPLAALAEVTLDAPGAVYVLVCDGDRVRRTAASSSSGSHGIEVVGLRAETPFTLRAVAELDDGSELRSGSASFTTDALPDDLPPLSTTGATDDDGMVFVLGPTTPNAGGDDPDRPFFVGVDRAGQVVWLYDPDDLDIGSVNGRVAELRDDGDLDLMLRAGMRAITPGGATVADLGAGQNVHHDFEPLPGGGAVFLTRIIQALDVAELGGVVDVMGDGLVEIDAAGAVVWTWDAFEHVPLDFSHPLAAEPNPQGRYDWTHGNAVSLSPDGDFFIVSLRHQNAVIAIDRTDGSIAWTLGEGRDFDLALGGSWFDSQHAASVSGTGDQLQVLLYDNGNLRDTTSRAVAYDIDLGAGTATEAWSWDVGFLTSNFGDARLLEGGDFLVGAGGVRGTDDAALVSQVSPTGEAVWSLEIGDGRWFSRVLPVQWLFEVE